MHMELQIDDTIIMIADATEQFAANTHLAHVYVPDVDHIYNKALELGVTYLERPRERKGDPDRRGTFKDFLRATSDL